MFHRQRSLFLLFTVLYITFILKPPRSSCWNLALVNLPEDVLIWKFAVWRNRAYLAVPRWRTGSRNRKPETAVASTTLYEAVWPESNIPVVTTSKILPSVFRNKPNNDKCLRSVTALNVDFRGRLWTLEVPDKYDCWARIVIYDLRRDNQLIVSAVLRNIPTKDLRALAVDQWGSKGFIGDPGDESILTFNLDTGNWWRIKMIHGPNIPRVFTTDIAISRKTSVLYMTGSNSLDLFSINLQDLANDKEDTFSNNKTENIRVSWHGTKLGTSTGLFCDFKDGLHYFLTSEKASVRWDTRLPLKAENHAILLQSEFYPCITDYAMDAQKNVWGLTNTKCPFTKNKTCNSTRLWVRSRTVKIAKYLQAL